MDKMQVALDIFGAEIVEEFGRIMIEEDRVASGKLLKSLKHKVTNTKKGFGIRILAANYYGAVDNGRKKGSMPPISAISKWATIRGINQSAVWGIAKSIQKNGIKPANITSKALKNLTTMQAYKKFDDDVDDWVNDSIDKFLKDAFVTKSDKLAKVNFRL